MARIYFDMIPRIVFEKIWESFGAKKYSYEGFDNNTGVREYRVFFDLIPEKAKFNGLIGLRSFVCPKSGSLATILLLWEDSKVIDYDMCAFLGDPEAMEDFFDEAISEIQGGFDESFGKEGLFGFLPQGYLSFRSDNTLVDKIIFLTRRQIKNKSFVGERVRCHLLR